MTKVHRAGLDGLTGANLMSRLCATEVDKLPPDPGRLRRLCHWLVDRRGRVLVV
ncbi:hypothetical protein [Mycobacterium leprae]|uniref:hypothetical protein n=1 Tax=Mycobacterium leprae TaxID=1769 RepID=UPI002ED93F1F